MGRRKYEEKTVLSYEEGEKELPRPSGELILDLGCGDEKQVPEAIGIDSQEAASAADLIIDIEKDGIPYGANEVDAIYARMFAEHVDAAELLAECYEVLKPGGELYLTVPHPFTSGFWQDWTHTVQPGLTVDGISYLEEAHNMHYEHDMPSWDIEEIDVNFWLNLSSLPGRALSAAVSGIASFCSPHTCEELLKLPFAGGWLKATLVKPERRGE